MPAPLAVLIVEDVESDAQLTVYSLKKAGYEFVYERVETAGQMRAALEKQTWDIVISDYKLPHFDGRAALELLQETGLDIPFIVVSGTIGEETAVSMMKAGAHDYLVKGDLARLAPAMKRELEQAGIRHRRRQAEEALAASEAELRALFASMQDVVLVIDRDGVYRKVAPTNLKLLAIPPAELFGKNLREVFPVERAEEFIRTIQQVLDTEQTASVEYEILIGGKPMWFEASISPMDRDNTLWVAHDITARKQAKEALAASEAKLRALVEQSPAIVYTESVENGETVYISPQVEKLTGYTSAEWIQDHDLWKKMIHPEDLAAVLAEDERTTAAHEPFYIEYRVLTRDGRALWLHDEAVMIQNQDGTPLFWQGVIYDITERKQTEEHLKESEERHRTIIQTAMDGFWLTDMQGRLLEVNETYCRMSGYSVQELLTMRIADLEDVLTDADVIARIDNIMIQGDNHFESRHRRKDGSIFHVEVSVQYQPIEGGRLVTFLKDISERKQAEEAVQTMNILLEQTLEQSPVPMVLVSMPDGIIRSANSACVRFLGMEDESSPVGAPLSELNISWQDFDMQGNLSVIADLPLPRSLMGLKTIQERRILRKDGTSVYGLMYGSPIFDNVGKLIAGYLVMVDITERKQVEETLQISEERYRKLFDSMVDGFVLHEIICDESGKPVDYRFLEVNPAYEHLTGLQAESLIGRTVLEIMPNTDPYWIKVFGDVALTGRSTFYENYSGELGRYFEVSVYCPQPGQFAVFMEDITERKQAEQSIHQRVIELEMLHQSGLELGQLLNPREIGQKILELLKEKMGWHHTRIRLYHPQDDSLELLDFNQPGLQGERERREAVERFQTLITRSGQGMSGWVIQNGQSVRSGNVSKDPRYVEAYPGINSGLYVPMKLGERIIGVISIEDEKPNLFSAADEQLIVTLANQAASAFENARLFEETRQRVMELETINRISLVLRAASRQDEMLSIVLDEALAILNTSHGSISLYSKTTDTLEKTIMRGWTAQAVEPPQSIREGIAGKVFTSGDIHISREFASDPETHSESRNQMPPNWGGICLPIRTTQQTLGVMSVSVPSERELGKDEIRLLSILSEMTGAALQRMQLHEQTIRRLEQLHALRAVDQAIVSNLDMPLTLNILLDHSMSQLGVDAADVLLLQPGSNMLEFAAGRGFHTLLFESVNLSDSFAKHAIMEHRLISVLDPETAPLRENPRFENLWKAERFVCYWCVPLVIKGEVKGVLEIYCRTAFTPDAEWLEFLEALAGQAAIAIDNTQLFENLQHANLDLSLAYDATIEGWSRAMDLRDHETEGHTLRVTDLTLKLARAMRVSESQLTAIRRGALLHDIGKMGVPDAILLKEGALTDEEWLAMRKHPELARDMLMPIAYLNDALDIPYCHHEKWDGTGYPQGLKGDRIPLIARIFAVVDVWDALTNDRTYRKKWTEQDTRQYIKEQSGKHFDPQVVEVFLEQIGNEP